MTARTGLLATGTPEQILRALLGARPDVQELRTELDDLEGMSDSTAAYLYGTLARKQAYEALVAQRFFALNMRSPR